MKRTKTLVIYRILAEKQLRLPGIDVARWVSLKCELTEDHLSVKNDVFIRPATKEDLDFLSNTEDKSDSQNRILLQDIKFWNEYGFRCLYAGHKQGDPQPLCMCYFIDHSDNHRFKKMEYGAMYEALTPDTVHVEGAYVCKNMRRKGLFLKFCHKRNKLFYQNGKKFVRSHVIVDKSGVPMLKILKKVGFVPNKFISRVKIHLPFVRSDLFVHHPIKESDHKRFPMTFFDGKDR
jgi:hypothetical protein